MTSSTMMTQLQPPTFATNIYYRHTHNLRSSPFQPLPTYHVLLFIGHLNMSYITTWPEQYIIGNYDTLLILQWMSIIDVTRLSCHNFNYQHLLRTSATSTCTIYSCRIFNQYPRCSHKILPCHQGLPNDHD